VAGYQTVTLPASRGSGSGTCPPAEEAGEGLASRSTGQPGAAAVAAAGQASRSNPRRQLPGAEEAASGPAPCQTAAPSGLRN
jgi:hypothetical protein